MTDNKFQNFSTLGIVDWSSVRNNLSFYKELLKEICEATGL